MLVNRWWRLFLDGSSLVVLTGKVLPLAVCVEEVDTEGPREVLPQLVPGTATSTAAPYGPG